MSPDAADREVRRGPATRPAIRVNCSLCWGLLSRASSPLERVRTVEVIAGPGTRGCCSITAPVRRFL